MRKYLRMAIACVCIMSSLSINTIAFESVSPISENYAAEEFSLTRATNSFSMSIAANKKSAADTVFSLSAGETVRIRAFYNPADASLDFGLLDSENVFHYVNVKSGSIDKTIEIPKNGSYRLAVRNNSNTTVDVSGSVIY